VLKTGILAVIIMYLEDVCPSLSRFSLARDFPNEFLYILSAADALNGMASLFWARLSKFLAQAGSLQSRKQKNFHNKPVKLNTRIFTYW
jgi:hypothetical protein